MQTTILWRPLSNHSFCCVIIDLAYLPVNILCIARLQITWWFSPLTNVEGWPFLLDGHLTLPVSITGKRVRIAIPHLINYGFPFNKVSGDTWSTLITLASGHSNVPAERKAYLESDHALLELPNKYNSCYMFPYDICSQR